MHSENQNFEKMKKMPKDIILTSVPKIMIICYTVPEMFSFWAIFCTFTPLYNITPITQNIKFKKKKAWRYRILQMCTINYDYMMYGF